MGCAWRRARSRPEASLTGGPSISASVSPSWPPSATTSRSSRRLPVADRSRVDFGTVRGAQFLEPLFEFSGRVRGLRRDPVSQAAVAAVRRPADRGQRHRLLVDLRRQPADHAVDDRRRRAAGRRGPTRCLRTTRSSGWGCGSPPIATPSWPVGASSNCATSWAAIWSTRSSPPRSSANRSCEHSASGSRCYRSGWPAPRAGRRGSTQRARPSGPSQRVDRRRRRVGV